MILVNGPVVLIEGGVEVEGPPPRVHPARASQGLFYLYFFGRGILIIIKGALVYVLREAAEKKVLLLKAGPLRGGEGGKGPSH